MQPDSRSRARIRRFELLIVQESLLDVLLAADDPNDLANRGAPHRFQFVTGGAVRACHTRHAGGVQDRLGQERRTVHGRSFSGAQDAGDRKGPDRERKTSFPLSEDQAVGLDRRDFQRRGYTTPPEAGLRALGRVFAGWAYSQGFFGERRHYELGLGSWEEVLRDAECEYLKHDANDMLASIRTWQMSDISANERYRDNMERALRAIRARAIVVPCTTDLCCPPEHNAFEVERMLNAELRPYVSSWGHRAASPTRGSAAFMRFLDGCLWELLAV